MDDKSATLAQAKQILNLIAQSEASSEAVQLVLASGFLVDLFHASRFRCRLQDIDRRDFQVLLGIIQRRAVRVEPYNISAIEVRLRNTEDPRRGVLEGFIRPETMAHDATLELVPSALIPDLRDMESIQAVLGRLAEMRYRLATTHELIALERDHGSDALGCRGIIGGNLRINSIQDACLEFCWRCDEGPTLYRPALILRTFSEAWDSRWKIAVVRI
jgi:hypothetical protein